MISGENVILVAVPVFPLAASWVIAFRGGFAGKLAWSVLAVQTASYLLLVAEMLFPETWGEVRSTRLSTISINWWIVAASFVAIGRSRSSATGWLFLSTIMLLVLWTCAAMVNSVV